MSERKPRAEKLPPKERKPPSPKLPPSERMLLSTLEASRELGMCVDQLYAELASKRLKGIRVGRIWRVPRQALATWVSERMEGTDAA